MKLLLLFPLLLLLMPGQSLLAQAHVMTNGTINSCSGTFYDPGGTANYGNNANFTMTICPSTPGTRVILNFSSFITENGSDFMTIYDGATVAAPSLGVYTGIAGPGIVSATSANATGCITIRFTSNGFATAAGWEAAVSCASPCQQVIAGLTANPLPNLGQFIDICPGELVAVDGNATSYPNNNASYAQSNATSTFSWTFGDGTFGNGITASHAYATPGIYQLKLRVTDAAGCTNSNDIQTLVRVAAKPVFGGTSVTQPSICLGQSNTLTGIVTPQEIDLDCTPPVSGLTYLPDGTGASYTTSINVDCYGLGSALTNINQLEDICLNMEHSYAGDLTIQIKCPNGTTVDLVTYGGMGNQFVGQPVDNTVAGLNGNGYNYCFSSLANQTWLELVNAGAPLYSYVDNGGTNVNNHAYIPAGTYEPSGNLNTLLGCPLNGAWSIVVIDNLGQDDGYIFDWNINFSNTLTPVSSVFTPLIANSGWVPDPTITAATANNITVVPVATGNTCYTFQATDVFGCVNDTTICFTVLAPGSPGCPACLITNFTANSNLANCTDEYVTTGSIQFAMAPASGTLIVEDCQGNQVIAANAPFISPVNYTLTGTDADGTPCFFRAYFSDNITCDSQIDFTYPASNLPDEAGTVTATLNGNSIHDYIVCNGDNVTVTSNDDWAIPPLVPGNDPGLGYLIYSCPPTPGGVGVDPAADPCLEGFIAAEDITLLNDGGAASTTLSGFFNTPVNNTFYAVPMTFGSIGSSTYIEDCYDLAIDQMVTIQFLNPIQPAIAQNCETGTAVITLTGGYPQFHAGNYTASGLTPATAAFVNSTALHGGTITLNGLTNGETWSFIVTDGNGCPITVTGTFTGLQNAAFTYPQPEYCRNAPNPAPLVTGVTGGTFSSAAGITLNPASGLINLLASTPGTYTITYTTPGPTCQGTATFVVTIHPQPAVNGGTDQAVCNGAQVTLTATGADTYTWTDGITNGIPFTPALGTTTYTVTGTNNLTGCINTDMVIVTVNPIPLVDAGADLTLCNGQQATLSASGTAGVTYAWSDGIANAVAFTPALGTSLYTVTATTAAGCTHTDQVSVTVNPLPVVNAGPDVSVCTGSPVTLTATGAATYAWTGGIANAIPFTPVATTTYTVTGTAATGCIYTDLVTVTVLLNAPINAGPDVTICTGQSTQLTATGGVSYSWNNGLGAGNNFAVSPTVTTIYTASGTDANGCSGTDNVTITVNPLPLVNAGIDRTVCAGTDITLTATGANTYAWTDGIANGVVFTPVVGAHIYTVTGTSATGCVNTDAVSVTVHPLPLVDGGVDQTVCAGTSLTLTGSGAPILTWDNGISNGVAFAPVVGTLVYTVTGTDANGCVDTDAVSVTVNPLPLVNGGADLTVCSGTSVTLTGTGAQTYTWNNGVTNGISFVPTVGTTIYTVTGINANGCLNTDAVSVTVNPNPVPVINGASDYCSNATAGLVTTLPFATYLWSTGATTAGISVTQAANPISVTVTNTFGCSATSPGFIVNETSVVTANFSLAICQGQSVLIHGMPRSVAGTYSEVFVSSTGCDSTANVTLTVNPLPPVNAGMDQQVCTGATVTLAGSGAQNYVWTNNVTNNSSFVPAVGTLTYTLTGTDANGCSNTDVVAVTVHPLPVVSAGADVAVCIGQSVVLSGVGAQTYVWNNNVTNGTSFNPIGTNIFTLTGTDVNGCVQTDQVLVTVNPLPVVSAGADQDFCAGELALLVGSGAQTYQWSNGVINNIPFIPAVGTTVYTVTGTDANGCQNIDQVQLVTYALPSVEAGVNQAVCIGSQVTLNGSGALSYVWNNGGIDGVAFTPGLGAVPYTVTGTDAHGCHATDNVVVTVHPLPLIGAGPDLSICDGAAVTLSGTGGITYTWNNNVVNGVSFVPLTGTVIYTVTGTNANGCVNTDQVVVTVHPNPHVQAGNDVIACAGSDITLTGSGAQSYTWNNGISNGIPFTPGYAFTYIVTGTTAAGCQGTDSLNVSIEALPVISIQPNVTTGCAPLEVTFTNNSTGGVNCTWIFNNGGTAQGCGTIIHTFPYAGCYDVTFMTTSATGCTAQLVYEDLICLSADPKASFVPSPGLLTQMATTTEMINSSLGATTYLWDFGDYTPNSTLFEPSHSYPTAEAGDYIIMLIAYNAMGCSDTAYAHVEVQEDLLFFVPNAFTPDGDANNPVFQPVFTSGFDPQDFSLHIFNRWGQVVFESHDASKGWSGSYGVDGKFAEDGVYTWKIEFKTTMSDERKMAVGHVTILR